MQFIWEAMSKYQQHSGVNTNFEQTQGMGPLVKKKKALSERGSAGHCRRQLALCTPGEGPPGRRTLAVLPSHRPSPAAQPGGAVRGFAMPGEELCTASWFGNKGGNNRAGRVQHFVSCR